MDSDEEFLEGEYKDVSEYLVIDLRMQWRGCFLGHLRSVFDERGKSAEEGQKQAL